MKIRFPEEITLEDKVGGKARALAQMVQFFPHQNITIPPWFVVLDDGDEIDEAAIMQAVARLGGEQFAVRSSAEGEDGKGSSFAGQFESFLFVAKADIIAKIRAVRASGISQRVQQYQHHRGEAVASVAVIVQKMILADSAGVSFSANPHNGRRDEAVVAAVRGVGEALVSGEKTGDSWVVDNQAKIVSATLGDEGVNFCLSQKQVTQIAELARFLEEKFCCPQDIEWAILADKILLLQSRPITTLQFFPDPSDELVIWDNSNIAESYGGVTTPLTFSFARRAYESVYREFCKILKVRRAKIHRAENTFANMLGLVRGRIYYNLLSWYRVLALLPGFALNRAFMEQMMGVKQPLPDEIVAKIVAENRENRWRAWLDLGLCLLGLLKSQILLPQQIRAFYRRLAVSLAPPEKNLAQMTGNELIGYYRQLEQQLLTRWDAPLVNDFFCMIYFGILRSLCQKWLASPDGAIANELVQSADIISIEPTRRIVQMAKIAKSQPEVLNILADKKTLALGKIAILTNAEKFPQFAPHLQNYLAKFGDRCLGELKLESLPLGEQPDLLLQSILASTQNPRSSFDQAANSAAKEVKIPNFAKNLFFQFILRQARSRVRDRENLRFERTRLFGRVRQIFCQIGKRLFADGVLAKPRDIFYLNLEEILALYENGATSGQNLDKIIKLRQHEFSSYRENPAPPDRFASRGALHRYRNFSPDINPSSEDATKTASQNAAILQGLGCYPGVVRGRVRVVQDAENAALEQGEILVAKQTDPGWVLLFPRASALLVERGSLLSHSAIVARELCLPTIVAIPNLLDNLQTGAEVEIDGGSGQVKILEKK